MENLPGVVSNSPAPATTRRAHHTITLGGPGNSHKKPGFLNRFRGKSRKITPSPVIFVGDASSSNNSDSNSDSNIKPGNYPNLNAQLAAFLEEDSAPTGGPGGPVPPKKSIFGHMFTKKNSTKNKQLPNGMANLIKSRTSFAANSNHLIESYYKFLGKCIEIIRHLQSGANQHYADKSTFDLYWKRLTGALRNFDATKSTKAAAFVNEIYDIHRNINDLLRRPIRMDKKLADNLQKLSVKVKTLDILHRFGDRLKALKEGGKRKTRKH